MATFGERIEALTGLDVVDSSGSLNTTNLVGDETAGELCAAWLSEGAKEIINVLPMPLKIKCGTRTSITDLNGADLDTKGEILHVTRLSADSGGFEKSCRPIPGMFGDLTNDSSDLMFYATVTDPVYFITNNASGNPTLFVRPNPTSAQPAYVHRVGYPSVLASATIIANFPDVAEYLVVLYAAIKATEYMMLSEEDQEVYAPQLTTLKQDYSEGLSKLTKAAVSEGGKR